MFQLKLPSRWLVVGCLCFACALCCCHSCRDWYDGNLSTICLSLYRLCPWHLLCRNCSNNKQFGITTYFTTNMWLQPIFSLRTVPCCKSVGAIATRPPSPSITASIGLLCELSLHGARKTIQKSVCKLQRHVPFGSDGQLQLTSEDLQCRQEAAETHTSSAETGQPNHCGND
jgi:hypothetical protein